MWGGYWAQDGTSRFVHIYGGGFYPGSQWWGDTAALLQVSGVGKKTAQRIMLELKDKLRRLGQEADIDHLPATDPDLAVAALLQLGYTGRK